jgi:hypothetical protein
LKNQFFSSSISLKFFSYNVVEINILI